MNTHKYIVCQIVVNTVEENKNSVMRIEYVRKGKGIWFFVHFMQVFVYIILFLGEL